MNYTFLILISPLRTHAHQYVQLIITPPLQQGTVSLIVKYQPGPCHLMSGVYFSAEHTTVQMSSRDKSGILL